VIGLGAAGLPAAEMPEPLAVTERTLARPGVTVATLENGLTVIIAENRNAPVVCVRAYVRAGGLYEGKYLGCGISHLTEHLVAKGAVHDMGQATAKEARQTSARVDDIGGQSNAYTSYDHTCYYIAATAGKTNECIDLVADWMARPEITKKDFEREHGVVQRELEMGKDDPSRQLWYAHARNFYRTHPAGVPVIGYLAPLSRLQYQDVLDYHEGTYIPQNMIFAVVGDVKTEQVLRRVRRAFAGFKPDRKPELALPEVPKPAGVRRVILTNPSVKEATEYLSFRTIPLVHEDLYPLDVLSFILTQGVSSRLERTVHREQKLITHVDSSSWTPDWGAGQFTIEFRTEAAKADQAEEAILTQLRKVVAEGVSDKELARAKRQKVAAHVYSRQSVEQQAAGLASDYLSTGDVDFSRRYTKRIQAVTAEEVRAVARKYLDFDAMVITRMVPEGEAVAVDGAEEEAGVGETKVFALDNGLRVVLHSTPAVELVSASLVVEGGVLTETDETSGMGNLATALSTRGTQTLSAEQLADFFAQAGGSINGSCGNNTLYWQMTVLSDSFEKALPVYADVVLRPKMSAEELEILRKSVLARIARRMESWNGQLNSHFRRDFFRESPLRREPIGRAEVVAEATAEQVADYHRKHLKAGSAVLAVYGQFDLERTAELVEMVFEEFPTGRVALPEVDPREVARDGEVYVHPSKLQGAAVMVGAPGMRLSNLDDRLPIDVLDTIISGYRLPRGWLHSELRGRKLVYVVHAYNWAALVPGAFMTYAQCEADKADQVAGIIRSKYRQTLDHEYTREEVDEAVNIILTADLLGKQSMQSLAMQAALNELYGFGYDFPKKYEKLLRAVTPEDVAAVAKKYLSGGYVTTVVTPRPEAIEPGDQ
jgi:zinc protease